MIYERITTEAKRMLVETNFTIGKIGNYLGFDHDSYFVKYFKKQTTISPLDFRKRAAVANVAGINRINKKVLSRTKQPSKCGVFNAEKIVLAGISCSFFFTIVTSQSLVISLKGICRKNVSI
ncbi:helix-turn-helix protein [Flavobacterium araucananum]|uniref:HTH araC/xylS-type domain-containing protein n=1 Tax=Flavobacterium araucananum TaxID=946678 RepID=A0A227NCU6_9FLAO|nr:helix-turn-helix domain-containing protein [Flavobacterium araucananum]OXE95276.1 hypothetical protein B0A64_24520 [Flavobacterium araucananum]PWJ95586.1 helix-turn-helix protein [Flavobacterium araucananum]